MADSMVFVKCKKKKAMERLVEYCPGEQIDIDEDGDYFYRGVSIYDFSDEWAVLSDEEGEYFEEELVIHLAQNDDLYYVYVDEDNLSGELIVMKNGKAIRKIRDFYNTPINNVNEGKIEYESNKMMQTWIDIGLFLEYLLNNL